MVNDLNVRGLIQDHRPYIARNRESSSALVSLEWTLSDLGRHFLSFILSPQAFEGESERDTSQWSKPWIKGPLRIESAVHSRETLLYRPICLNCNLQRKRPKIKQIGRYQSV